MTLNTLMIVIVVGVLIVVVLTAVAVYYLLRVRAVERERGELLEQQEIEKQKQRLQVNKSIQILAQGMIEEQLTLTEGAIRISALLSSIGVNDQVREEYGAFFLLASATEHIPILDAWKQLSTKKKLHFDAQREQLEADHREFVLDAAARIKTRQF